MLWWNNHSWLAPWSSGRIVPLKRYEIVPMVIRFQLAWWRVPSHSGHLCSKSFAWLSRRCSEQALPTGGLRFGFWIIRVNIDFVSCCDLGKRALVVSEYIQHFWRTKHSPLPLLVGGQPRHTHHVRPPHVPTSLRIRLHYPYGRTGWHYSPQ
jgi:hypothetical protein